MARKLIAELILDPSQYIKGLRKATLASDEFVAKQRRTFQRETIRGTEGRFGLLGGLAGGFAGGGLAVGGGIAAGAALSGLKESVLAASDLNEQIAKTTTVFGASADQIEEWSKTTTTAFGISERDALKMASSFGALFAPVGLVGQEAADQSEKLTQLGGDLASFYNTDVQSALDAIQSGLVGQVRPLREYGVQLSAARVQQQALTDTGKKHAAELTNLEKTMARIKIIFQDTKKPQGDFARTQDHLANQTRILTANIDDLSTALGESLIPAVTDAFQALNALYGLMRKSPVSPGSVLGDILKQASGLGEVAKALELYRHLFGGGDGKKPAGVDVLAPAGALGPTVGAPAGALGPTGVGPLGPLKATAEQRNAWFDAMIGRKELRAGLLTSATAQLAAYKAIGVLLTQQIAAVHDMTRKLNLKDQALQNAAMVAGLEAQIAADLKQKQLDAAQKLKDQIAAAKQEHEDWLAFAYEKAQTTKTVKDDLKTAQANLDYWKKQARTGKYTVDEARQVLHWQQELKNLRKQGQDTDPLAGLMQVSSARLAAILAVGTGLSARGRAILGMNIAGAEIQPMHIHVNIDGREVGRAVTKDQARTSKRTAQQTSGRRG